MTRSEDKKLNFPDFPGIQTNFCGFFNVSQDILSGVTKKQNFIEFGQELREKIANKRSGTVYFLFTYYLERKKTERSEFPGPPRLHG